MNNPGFYISKLRAEGPSTEPADISFTPGFNVVSGASDTGKSYMFQCIDYMLGAKNPPKYVPESKGYTKILMEITTYDNHVYTLMREISKEGSITKKECSLENFWDLSTNSDLLSPVHKAGEPNNLSRFLLSISGFPDDIQIIKNERNVKRTLSYRDIVHLSAINEEEVIKELSPVFSGQYMYKTEEKSVFNFLLTGDDSKALIEVQDPKTRKKYLQAQLELVKDMISTINEKIKVYNTENQLKKETHLAKALTEITAKFSDVEQRMRDLVTERKNTWEKIESTNAKITNTSEVLKRFDLLRQHYESDLQRLEFIVEGDHLIAQLKSVECTCPLCGETIDPHKDRQQSVDKAVHAEIQKIRKNTEDLTLTIKDLHTEDEANKKSLLEYQKLFHDYDTQIKEELEPFKHTLQIQIEKLAAEQKEVIEFKAIKNQLNSLTEKRNDIDLELKTKSSEKASKGSISHSSYRQFCDEVERLLVNWNYLEANSIEFSHEKEFDIEITGKPRVSHGKGVRSLTYTAFVVGLMNYCISKELPHPRCVVVDSPLTSFKDKDKNKSKDKEEEVGTEVQNAFFEDLANTPKDRQIIIFDNKDPQYDVKSRINHTHFSGRSDTGREGFFPIKKQLD